MSADQCPICLESVTDQWAFQCLHKAHYSCIAPAFENADDAGCPVCRTPATTADLQRFHVLSSEAGVSIVGANGAWCEAANSYRALMADESPLPPPPAPFNIVPLCCPRVIPNGDGGFAPTQERQIPVHLFIES